MATPVRLFGSAQLFIPAGGTQSVSLTGLSTTDFQYVSLGVYVTQVSQSGAIIGNTDFNPAIIQPQSGFRITEVSADESTGTLFIVLENTSGSTLQGFVYVSGIGV